MICERGVEIIIIIIMIIIIRRRIKIIIIKKKHEAATHRASFEKGPDTAEPKLTRPHEILRTFCIDMRLATIRILLISLDHEKM